MQETRAVELAHDGGELFEKDALEVDVFLVRANDVGGGGEGVVVAGAAGGRCGVHMVGGFARGDHIVIALPLCLTLTAQRA